MSKPVTISRSSATKLPNSWSNRGRDEYLHPDAYASLSRALNIAVADTGVNFQIWDALRDLDEQVAMLKQNYRRVSRGRSKSSDRTWDGSTWEKRPGRPNTASPGWSNHGSGRAIDIHPGPIQEWFKNKGRDHGWDWSEGRRNGENWHFTHSSSRDRYKSRGVLDHGAVQKVVGADVDGKIGTGTVKAIKAWQTAHGLEADGIVGPGTKAAMLGKNVADVVEDVAEKVSEITKPVQAATDYTIERHQTKNLRVDRIDEKRGLVGKLNAITLHHWGSDGQNFDSVVNWLVADGNGNNQSSAHEVIEGGRVAILADMKDGTWNSGSAQGNVDNYALECRPEADAETVATVAARVAAIRAEAGVDLPLNIHSDYTATQCPGRYRDLLAEIDALSRGGTVNLGRPVVTPSKPSSSKLKVDGRWGQKTTTALQKRLGVTQDGRAGTQTWKALQRLLGAPYVDGEISRQSYKATELGNGIVPGPWEYTGRGSKGSQTIRLLQKRVGARADGIVYEGTTAALQRALNTGKV